MKKGALGLLVAIILLIVVFFAVGILLMGWASTEQQPQKQQPEPIGDNNSRIRIGAFNIQTFGEKKSENAKVMKSITSILSQYDLIAIQEIRDNSDTSILALMSTLPGYEYELSSRLGRTSSKEQYAIIYNPNRVQYITSYVYDDTNDTFEREPFIARFHSGSLDIVITVLHSKPDDAAGEIGALSSVISSEQARFVNESGFIVLGDLNADCSYYHGELIASMVSLISSDADTTTGSTNCAYDRIIVSRDLKQRIIDSGVEGFDKELNLTNEEARAVSDHYPVYAIIET